MCGDSSSDSVSTCFGVALRDGIAFACGESLGYRSRDKEPGKKAVQHHILQQQFIDGRNDLDMEGNKSSPIEDGIIAVQLQRTSS